MATPELIGPACRSSASARNSWSAMANTSAWIFSGSFRNVSIVMRGPSLYARTGTAPVWTGTAFSFVIGSPRGHRARRIDPVPGRPGEMDEGTELRLGDAHPADAGAGHGLGAAADDLIESSGANRADRAAGARGQQRPERAGSGVGDVDVAVPGDRDLRLRRPDHERIGRGRDRRGVTQGDPQYGLRARGGGLHQPRVAGVSLDELSPGDGRRHRVGVRAVVQ